MSIDSFLSAGDIDGLATFCEESELNAPQGIADPEIYGTLLAVYLLQNELDHAKLLWKRIPGSVKVSNPEIGELWELGKRLWRREFSEVYPLIEKTTWPPHILPLLGQLIEKVRHRVLVLVVHAYSTIGLTELCSLLGLQEDATLSVIKEKGWIMDESSKIVTPKRPESDVLHNVEESQCRLARLVDIVSFLEN